MLKKIIQWTLAKAVIALSAITSLIPRKVSWKLGKSLGRALYHLLPRYRKIAISNLLLCPKLHFFSKQEVELFAKESFENLGILVMDYLKLPHEKDLSSWVKPIGREEIIAQCGKGPIIFWNGHQANFEVAFFEGAHLFSGFAIAKPQKNPYLYAWVTKTREKFHGRLSDPKNVTRKALKALQSGECVGIVGDQSDIRHGIDGEFLGRKTPISPLAAFLSVKTGAPIVVVTTHRKEDHYEATYHPPFYPDQSLSPEKARQKIAQEVISCFEKSLLEAPKEWFWVHHRFKPKTKKPVPHSMRHDAIAIIPEPHNREKSEILKSKLEEIYEESLIEILDSPKSFLDARFKMVIAPSKDLDLNYLSSTLKTLTHEEIWAL